MVAECPNSGHMTEAGGQLSKLQNQSWVPFGWGWGPTWMVAKWSVISRGLTIFKTIFAFIPIFRTVSVSPTTPYKLGWCTALWEAERDSRDRPYQSMSWWRSYLGSHFVSWQALTFLRATILKQHGFQNSKRDCQPKMFVCPKWKTTVFRSVGLRLHYFLLIMPWICQNYFLLSHWSVLYGILIY